MTASTTLRLVIGGVLAVGSVGCTGDDDGSEGAIERDALVAVLLTEEDDVDLNSYGRVPMTAESPDGYYLEPPTQLCEAAHEVDLVGPDDMYAYMGDGGDYLYMDEWVSGETTEVATERFADGALALEVCVDDDELRLVESSHAGLDEVRLYERVVPESEHLTVLYARNGGVILLQLMDAVARIDKYDADQRAHLTETAVAKLAELGRVEVLASDS